MLYTVRCTGSPLFEAGADVTPSERPAAASGSGTPLIRWTARTRCCLTRYSA
ncbi:hypothetical protein LAJ19_19165 (plasmid) [Deinococcus taeanensis]|uniref:hypothetical protein n=1 Tax=Deinococcus taeanensis TaxID=2737050 RepID=UPI001CDB87C4|nr:hypothetical protein [Deinococcus taeanensis]UBV45167.1 hypothetical protein LAJ19_19165 [Deinococcus taeanensis]